MLWTRGPTLTLKYPKSLRFMFVVLAFGSVATVVGVLRHLRASNEAAPCATGTTACSKEIDPSAAEGAEDLTGKPRLVEFVSEHCPACSRMAPIVADLERRCLSQNEDSLVRVNVDEPEGEALAGRYKVRFLPTFLGVDAEGVEVMRMVGEQAPQKLASVLGEVRGQACPPVL